MPRLTTLFDFQDRTSRKLKMVTSNFERLQKKTNKPIAIRAMDHASKTIRVVDRSVNRLANRSYKVTVWSVDKASRTIGAIRRSLTSIPSMITVALAVVGIDKLKDATLGAAMNFEQYEVSMNHWLNGNTKKAKKLVTWMGQFADKTPFNSAELFPALTRGIGITSGDVKQAKKLLAISADMASLTPGKTVSDAMEAIADAQMGEFERMKEFNFKMTQKEFKAIGGWVGFMKQINKKFEGGANKLSQTAIGKISTIKGYIGTTFRSIGGGILDSLKPRLDIISNWIDNNQDKWAEWKATVQNAGKQGSEWLFSTLENSFNYIRTHYLENDNFKKLDFEGKIKFILGDINGWWKNKGQPALSSWWDSTGKPWAEEIGMSVGKAIFNGIVTGMKEGPKYVLGMWKNAFKDPSVSSFGGAAISTLLAASLGSIILAPLFKGVKGLSKVGKNFWDLGKSTKNQFSIGNQKMNTQPPKPPTPSYNDLTKQMYGSKKEVPKSKGLKLPKWLSNTGKGMKRLPLIGTALGALSLIGASKQEMPGQVGSLGGGMAGAAAGAAIGSVVPGVGTAIGGLAGGMLGSMGGEKVGDWIKNLDFSAIGQGIKDAFSSAGSWISDSIWTPLTDGFNSAKEGISIGWSSLSGWFESNVWTPISDAGINGINFIVGAWDIAHEGISSVWSSVSGWFNDNVWTPIQIGAGIAWEIISTKVSDTWTSISETWTSATTWFNESVWTPLSETAVSNWDSISTAATNAWSWASATWSTASEWFNENVWTPVSSAASTTGSWISSKFNEAWNWASGVWSPVAEWFESSVWSPLSTAVSTTGTWISDKFTEAWNWSSATWSSVSGWFQSTVWDPLVSGAETTLNWVSQKFQSAINWITSTWNSVKSTFQNISDRGSQITGMTPSGGAGGSGTSANGRLPAPTLHADGGRFTKAHMGIVAEAGTEWIIPTSGNKSRNISMWQQAGQELGVPLPTEQVAAATQSRTTSNNQSYGIRDIILQITGENHYSNDMDAEKVGKIAFEYIRNLLEEQKYTSGEMPVYD
ncbi:hypothetical protein ACQKCU_23825 [Heyndrickxia sporothermodurans]